MIQGFPLDLQIVSGPWCLYLDPEVLEVAMTLVRPRLHRGSSSFFEIIFGTLRPYKKPEGSSLDPEIFD